MNSIDGTAKAQDGCAIAYRIYPQPGKPRLVFIHSLALDGSIWNGVVKELGADLEILVYDCRGHGQSERRPGPYTAQLFADDLAALLDHCGWPAALLAGCSMGGTVALSFGAAYPKRAQGLALVDTAAWYGANALEEWRARGEKAANEGFAAMIDFQLSRWFSDGFREAHVEEVEAVARVFLANDVGCYQASCAMLGKADLRDAVRSFRMPVSVIVGKEDYATPLAMSQNLHDLIPGSTLTGIRGGRHLTPIQCPKEIAALLKNLARQATAPSSTESLSQARAL